MSFVESAWEADFAGNDDPIKLQNPIASQMSVMRSSLIGSLVANVRYNLNRKAGRVRVFEIGAIFKRNAAGAGRPAVGGRFRPAQARGRDRLRPGAWTSSGACRPARSTTSTSRPTWKRCSRRAQLRFVKADASGAASGPLGHGRAGRPGDRLHRRTASALAAEIRPAAGAGAVRSRCSCAATTPGAEATTRFRSSRAPRATSRWWSSRRSRHRICSTLLMPRSLLNPAGKHCASHCFV